MLRAPSMQSPRIAMMRTEDTQITEHFPKLGELFNPLWETPLREHFPGAEDPAAMRKKYFKRGIQVKSRKRKIRVLIRQFQTKGDNVHSSLWWHEIKEPDDELVMYLYNTDSEDAREEYIRNRQV